MVKKISRTWADLSMVLVAGIWGTTFVIVKNALADIGPFLFVGIRFLLAFLVLLALSHRDILKVRFSTLATGSLLGFFLCIGYSFQTLGLQYTSSSNAGFITGVSVVLVPIIYALMNRKKPRLITTLTVITAALGLFFISVPPGSFTLSYGDFLVLIGAFGFAFHIIYVDLFSHKFSAIAITAVQILFVGLMCTIIGLSTEPIPPYLSYNALWAIVITAIFATALAFLLQNYMQKFSTPTRFAVVLTAEPVFAALAGYFWAGEHLGRLGLIGAGMILAAMLVSTLFNKS
ncbi:MAG: putative DMT superfamily transporter inner membrane protein [Firmicutes bacterium ADurb.Bin456]|nr:MAG: putative DMT superfamily transporter inner membrane protein [Firmicutes bacterium ADurb.Bin456]